jgi:hypothetical protein
MAGPFQAVAPFLKASDYRQHFDIVDLIVSLDQTERLG